MCCSSCRPSRTRSFPLLFHGLVGHDEREGNSPSWFNWMEVQQVMKYALALREVRRNPIAAAEIGVITPYHKQASAVAWVSAYSACYM